MKSKKYIPERQDIVWIDFQPSVKQEIRGRHPAVVISSAIYSELTGMVVVVPITHARNNRLRDFFLPVGRTKNIEGYVNPLQFFTFSCQGRNVEYAGEILPDAVFAEVQRRIKQIIS